MDPAKARADAEGAQIVLARLVDSNQRSPSAIDQTEFVHIHLSGSANSLNRPHNAIILIHDDAMSARPSMVLVSLEEADVVRALILADMRIVGRRATQCASTRPDELTIVVVNVWSRIRVSVWREEDVTWGKKFRPEDIEVDNGSVEIRSLNDIRQVA